MALSLHTPSNPTTQKTPLIQHQFLITKPFNLKTKCCSNNNHNHATKARRNPKQSSFFEKIRQKWSLKIPSTRDKFPWQEQAPQQPKQLLQQSKVEEQEERGKDKEQTFAGTTDPVSDPLQHTVIRAPWDHGTGIRGTHLEFKQDKGRNSNGFFRDFEGSVAISVVDRAKNVGKESSFVKRIENDELGSIPVHVRTDKEGTIRGKGDKFYQFAEDFKVNAVDSVVDSDEIALKEDGSVTEIEKEIVFDGVSLEVNKDKEASDIEQCRNFDKFFKDFEDNVVSNVGKGDENVDKIFSCVKKTQKEIDIGGFIVEEMSDKSSVVDKLNSNGGFGEVKVSQEENIVDNHHKSGVSIELPWERQEDEEVDRTTRRSNTELAEKTLPEHELKRLRNMSLRMLERMKVGASGITQELVDSIHEKWRLNEVVKLKFGWPLSCNMKRTHEILEGRTGGLVIWRSGSSIVLYRGMAYNFHCVQTYAMKSEANVFNLPNANKIASDAEGDIEIKSQVQPVQQNIPDAAKYLKDLSQEELMDFTELNQLLDELGPRYKDWSGREPLPIDADLLPPVVPGYKPPIRILPYGVRRSLKNKEMTNFRHVARTMPPHFALGRSRELEGLANAMVILWEKSAIAKIAIKRGVQNTHNDRMAEELKGLTGGTLLSRNKEYIVFYRGNDFMPPAIMETLKETQEQTYLQQDGEEQARETALAFSESVIRTNSVPCIAGTLAETVAATSRWGNQPTAEDVEAMMRQLAVDRLGHLIKHLQDKLAHAKGKLKRAERFLAKVQELLEPKGLPDDLETISDEERFLFRKIGLSMKPYLLLGKRGVYDGVIENMHLHWKYRELVKIIVKRKNFAQVKHDAISLEAESGGLLVSLDKTTKGYAIVVYRGKNYQRPQALRPQNLLTRRQALARSIELQRREAIRHHITDLQERIELLKSELEEMVAGSDINVKEQTLQYILGDDSVSDDGSDEDEGEEAYLEVYNSSNEAMGDS